jgi:hypothetical protein
MTTTKRASHDVAVPAKRARAPSDASKPLLDASAFPHIWSRIASHAEYDLLLALRLVDHASCEVANKRLFRHVRLGDFGGFSRTSKAPELGWKTPVLGWVDGTLRRLPVASVANLSSSQRWEPYQFAAHPGWAHVHSLDLKDSFPGLEGVLPVLERVRANHTYLTPPATTGVIPIRVNETLYDGEGGVVVRSTGDTASMTRQVVVVRFAPDLPAMSWDPSEQAEFPEGCSERVDGVFIFDESPDGEDAVMDHENHEGIYEAMADELPMGRTFLHSFLAFAAHGEYKTYTFVGLEGLPRDALEKEFGVEIADGDDVAGAMRGWVLEAIRRVHTDEAEKDEDSDDEEERAPVDISDLDDRVQVLTADEYRGRVGEEQWRFETFADEPLNEEGFPAW